MHLIRARFVLGMLARHFVSRAFVTGCFLFSVFPAHATIGVSFQLLLGNPSGATSAATNFNNYLIQRDVEAISYNNAKRQPNWASWHYTPGDTGSSGRSGSFFQDSSLPPGFYQVLTTDYSGSGYDRGHMCPSGDRTASVPINEETFLMSNMIPQSPDNNQGLWANLENYSRAIAASNEVLVICGPEGFGSAVTSSSGQIPIASNVWKIIVAVPLGGGSTLSRITNNTRVIAVNIPNIQGIRTDPWQNYMTNVVLSWPTNATGYNLQQTTALNPSTWTNYVGAVNTSGTNKTVTLTTPTGRMFFRLSNP